MSNIINLPPNDKSGLYRAPSHAEGGVQVIIDDKEKVEVEGKEWHFCREVFDSDKVFEFKDKTNLEILTEIFQENSCVFEQGKSKAHDFIMCKLVVLDNKKRSIKGTAKQIINTMQDEKACNMTSDGEKAQVKAKGGNVKSDSGHEGIGEDEGMIHNEGLQIAAGLVVILDGKILLGHPTKAKWYGTYSIPKSVVEPNENFLSTALREAQEEMGLTLKKQVIDKLTQNFSESHPNFISYKRKNGKEYKRVFYFVVPISNLEKDTNLTSERIDKDRLQQEEMDWAGFISLEEAKKRITPQQLAILDEIGQYLSKQKSSGQNLSKGGKAKQRKEIYQMTFDEFLSSIKLRNNSLPPMKGIVQHKEVEINRYFPDEDLVETIGKIQNTDSENKKDEYVRLQLEKFHYGKILEAFGKGIEISPQVAAFYLSDHSLLNTNYGMEFLKKIMKKQKSGKDRILYNSHGNVTIWADIRETEVTERGNYKAKDFDSWEKKYKIKPTDQAIWITPSRNAAASYLDPERRDEILEMSDEELDKFIEEEDFEAPYEFNESEGVVIQESDDGDNGFLFAFKDDVKANGGHLSPNKNELNSAIDKMIEFEKQKSRPQIIRTAEFIRDFDLEKDTLIKAQFEDHKHWVKTFVPKKMILETEGLREKFGVGFSGSFLNEIYYADTEVLARLPKYTAKIEAEIKKGNIIDQAILNWAKDYVKRMNEFLPIAIKFEKMKERIVKRERKKDTEAKRIEQIKGSLNEEIKKALGEIAENFRVNIEENQLRYYYSVIEQYQKKVTETKKTNPYDLYTRNEWETAQLLSVNFMDIIDGRDFKLKENLKELIAEKAKKDSERVILQFIFKMTDKLGGLLSKIGKKVTVTKLTGGNILNNSIRFDFEDGSGFTIQNDIVFSHSVYGTPFYRYPTTFHNATLAEGVPIKNPSELSVKKAFNISENKKGDGGTLSEKSKILYLHGLGATPESDHVEILQSHDFEIIALRLNYQEKPLFDHLSSIIESQHPIAIIGHSMGGYVGFYLSNKYRIPALIFNPAFGSENLHLQPIPQEVLKMPVNKNQRAVIGLQDKDIPAKAQLNVLEKSECKIFVEKMAHDVPDKIKIKYFEKFVKELSRDNSNLKFEGGGEILLAPNGEKSNLNADQHWLVRTPEFKNWFGDWEKKYQIEKLQSQEAIELKNEISNCAIPDSNLSHRELRIYFTKKFDNYIVDNIDSGIKILISNKPVKKILHHNAEKIYQLYLPYIDSVLKNGILITSFSNGNPNVDQRMEVPYYLCFFSGVVDLSGDEKTAYFVVEKTKSHGYRLYDLTIFPKKKSELIRRNGLSKHRTPDNSDFLYRKDKKLSLIFNENSESISKVLDPNGEPLIVYHGTNKEITEFSHEKKGTHTPDNNTGLGFFFSKYIDEARVYMREIIWKETPEKYETLEGGKIYPVFLSIKNPLEVAYAESLNIEKIKSRLKKSHDGIIDERGDFIAFHPTQIKDATGRNITFDSNNSNIYLKKGGGLKQLEKNNLGGYDYKGDEMERAKKVDLLTLPKGIDGTNCKNCSFINKDNFCIHHKIRLYVTEKMCCALWTAPSASRSWEFFDRGGETTEYFEMYHQTDRKSAKNILAHGFNTAEVWLAPDDEGSYGEVAISVSVPKLQSPFFLDKDTLIQFYEEKGEEIGYESAQKIVLQNIKLYGNLGGEQGGKKTYDKLRELGYDAVVEGGDIGYLYPQRLLIKKKKKELGGDLFEKTESESESATDTTEPSKAPHGKVVDEMIETLKTNYIDKADIILALHKTQQIQRFALEKWILNPANDVKVIIAFSGGKDSVAMVLKAIEMGIKKENIELWHHEVDGEGEQLFDWKCTRSYCKAFAKAMGIPILFSYARGGILREMYRENETIQPIYFQKQMDGEFFEILPQDRKEFYNTRRKFPAVGADLNTRWCSWIAKISVMQKAINHSEKYDNVNLVIMTGERRQESTARSKYNEIEKYRSFSKGRRAISWRPIIDWSEKQVWEIIEKYKVQPHPCYELGWGRCSCQLCIFSSENTWASIQEISPAKVRRIDEIERDFNFTLYAEKKIKENKKVVGSLKGIYETKVNRGKSFISPEKKERWLREALGEFVSPIFVEKWEVPAGAFNGETSGAS